METFFRAGILDAPIPTLRATAFLGRWPLRVKNKIQEFGKPPWRCADFKLDLRQRQNQRAGLAAHLKPLDSLTP
jgi:hypothetical protein